MNYHFLIFEKIYLITCFYRLKFEAILAQNRHLEASDQKSLLQRPPLKLDFTSLTPFQISKTMQKMAQKSNFEKHCYASYSFDFRDTSRNFLQVKRGPKIWFPALGGDLGLETVIQAL